MTESSLAYFEIVSFSVSDSDDCADGYAAGVSGSSSSGGAMSGVGNGLLKSGKSQSEII